MSLRELSREHTGIASDPGYERLRAIASKEDGAEQQHTLNTLLIANRLAGNLSFLR